MPIYEKNNTKILHVHIPKTAGSSVTELFRRNGWAVDKWSEDGMGGQHLTRDHWKLWGDFDYVFTIVRHPVFRALSDARGRVENEEEVDHWVQDWCKEPYQKHGDHNRPQVDFFKQGDGDIFYFNDKTYQKKLISMATFFEPCTSNKIQKFPHVKGHTHYPHSPKILSLHTLELIQSTYQEDMDEFNFHWLGLEDL